ncbi:disulfide bond formation protein DsbC [Granulicella sp. WH15]|nr:disulfide bond formation protein DsbC [Granulicella sp. WH15]
MGLALLQFNVSMDFAPKPKQYVAFAAELATVPAGKRAELELRFRVAGGFHVNSHTPKSELLIPTRLELVPAVGVKVAEAVYPAGKSYSFSFSPKESLDVYSDDFVVKVPVVAAAGEHELKGTLRYQACDRAACYPPKSLPVDVLFTAK